MEKRVRVFVQNQESGEPAYYFGQPDQLTRDAMWDFIREEIKGAVDRGDGRLHILMTFPKMSDQEIDELPDL